MNIIDCFLENWKERNTEYYLGLCNEYISLKDKHREIVDKFGLHSMRINQILPIEYTEIKKSIKDFEFKLTKQTFNIISNATRLQAKPVEVVESVLSKEVIVKKSNLIKKVEKKAGKIVDTNGLYIGEDGNINGYIVGETNNVKVTTIAAGGYNVQCYHFRVLVK